MRQIGQISYLRKETNLTLIGVVANQEIRFQRMIQRKKLGDPKTIEEFIKIEKKDNNEGIQRVDDCIKLADIIIFNEKQLSELYHQIDVSMSKYNI